ncbi:hypothetical protein Pcinc_036728 [Petrolisthes cinctipes]|uniref:Uncharacterized protein n=1 Tax=Petrolisthes cinctipes TaxID=88211 RepID=A0AAE1EMA6_PETCI|nr:hypothetical protein Pcinc_036728 [Petrolisthes cinctipes]
MVVACFCGGWQCVRVYLVFKCRSAVTIHFKQWCADPWPYVAKLRSCQGRGPPPPPSRGRLLGKSQSRRPTHRNFRRSNQRRECD